MSELRQREPRERDDAYLAFVRTQPCTTCGSHGPIDAAHIRALSPEYGKRLTGKGEKPHDRWAVPLCRDCHRAQHSMNELEWWASKGFPDPFAIAVALYAVRPQPSKPQPERRKRTKPPRPRKPKASRQPIPQRADPWPKGRKLLTKNNLRKER